MEAKKCFEKWIVESFLYEGHLGKGIFFSQLHFNIPTFFLLLLSNLNGIPSSFYFDGKVESCLSQLYPYRRPSKFYYSTSTTLEECCTSVRESAEEEASQCRDFPPRLQKSSTYFYNGSPLRKGGSNYCNTLNTSVE